MSIRKNSVRNAKTPNELMIVKEAEDFTVIRGQKIKKMIWFTRIPVVRSTGSDLGFHVCKGALTVPTPRAILRTKQNNVCETHGRAAGLRWGGVYDGPDAVCVFTGVASRSCARRQGWVADRRAKSHPHAADIYEGEVKAPERQ